MIVLSCRRELTRILSIVGRKSLKVFASVLGRMMSFDGGLAVLEAFNRSRLDGLDELEPDDMERVVVFCFLLDFAHESGVKGSEKELGGGEIVCFVVLVVEENLVGAESLRCRDGVAGVAPDDICHHGEALRIAEVSDGIHSAINEIIPYSVLKIDETAGLSEEGRHAGATKVVAVMRG